MTATSSTTQPRHAPCASTPNETPPRFDQRISAVSGINVLVIVGSRARTLGPQLIKLAAQSSPDGIRLNVFDGLAELPPYCETVPTQRTPDCVVSTARCGCRRAGGAGLDPLPRTRTRDAAQRN